MIFDVLFGVPKQMGEIGMMTMWFSFYLVSVLCMLLDDTQGNTRDFMAASQAACCINLCTMSWAIVNGANLVKASLYTVNTDFGLTVLAWSYFEGDVFGSNAMGVFNYFHVIMAVMFFINNLIGLVAITRDRQGWVEFLGEENNAGENRANV
jgi:fumarate reductase subunit C